MGCKNCNIEKGEMHDVNGCFDYQEDDVLGGLTQEEISALHREWKQNKDINEFTKERLTGEPIHDYLIQKGRI